eukprot:10324585-Prorocentrum_lima.AAC.1
MEELRMLEADEKAAENRKSSWKLKTLLWGMLLLWNREVMCERPITPIAIPHTLHPKPHLADST